MVKVRVPGVSAPVTFAGTSWLFSNIAEFGEPVEPSDGPPEVFGISMEAFGGPRWWNGEEKTARHWLDGIPAAVRALIRDARCQLLLDMSNEGQIFLPDWFAVLHEGLREADIPPGACTILQQNRRLADAYLKWAQGKGEEPVAIQVYDHFPRRMLGVASSWDDDIEFEMRPRERLFCCMNYTPRPNRTGLVSWLLAGGFDRLGYISYSLNQKQAGLQDGLAVFPWFPEMETVQRGLAMLRERAPLVIDLKDDTAAVPEYDPGPKAMYANSYFSIVTESEISDGAVVRITEKTLKPLLMMHPLIVMGNPGSLKLLRDMGFQTFGDVFDESYDEIEDPVRRVRLLMSELARVLHLPSAQLHEMFVGQRSRVVGNYLLARRYLSAYANRVVEPELVRDMRPVRSTQPFPIREDA